MARASPHLTWDRCHYSDPDSLCCTGIRIFCTQERSQLKNKERALSLLRSKLFEMETEKQRAEISAKRKSQVSSLQPVWFMKCFLQQMCKQLADGISQSKCNHLQQESLQPRAVHYPTGHIYKCLSCQQQMNVMTPSAPESTECSLCLDTSKHPLCFSVHPAEVLSDRP